MTIEKYMVNLTAALDESSWNWLDENLPSIADAIKKEVHQGATPEEIYQTVMRHTQRSALALRCKQASQHLNTLKDTE